MKKKPTTCVGTRRRDVQQYEVTLRRDVQQVTCVRVEASSRQEAIDVAGSVTDDAAWNIEERIGTHKPEVHLRRKRPR